MLLPRTTLRPAWLQANEQVGLLIMEGCSLVAQLMAVESLPLRSAVMGVAPRRRRRVLARITLRL